MFYLFSLLERGEGRGRDRQRSTDRFSIDRIFFLKKKWPKQIFLKDYIYLFLERGEGREKQRERNIHVWLPLAHPQPGTRPTPRHVP